MAQRPAVKMHEARNVISGNLGWRTGREQPLKLSDQLVAQALVGIEMELPAMLEIQRVDRPVALRAVILKWMPDDI
ncbi:MAG: hypothetical protein HY246_05470, partial [Proteobacteria bacterium]|nr:hypothetical protein [Pseudomonadota bacterium]